MLRPLILAAALAAPAVFAGPMIPAGDLALRHDIQRLADHGVITGTTMTWPLAWAPILEDINRADATELAPDIVDALVRVRKRADWEARSRELTFDTKIGFADNATRIRSFQNTPRGDVDVSVGASWIDDWFAIDANVQYVDSDQDDEEFRVDDTFVGLVTGNWSIAASTQQRWWGPGWDGSIILSNNARPLPALTIDRIFTDPFETRWLSWLGPWDLSLMFGQLEEERVIPNALLFGFRFNFRPLPSLEIGLSRTATWCGDGRPCNASVFADLLIGRDNVGVDGIDRSNEPGNQLAGYDIRWTPSLLDRSVSFYLQMIGEDEAGGLPSKYLGQLGVEWSGVVAERWSARVFAEYAETVCQFYEDSEEYNCAYNHGTYKTGYRYRGRPIGHGADNDAELVSAGIILVDTNDTQWRVLLRNGQLNGGGPADARNTLTRTPQDIISIDVSHSRGLFSGTVEFGAGFEEIDDTTAGRTTSETRFYLQWRSGF